MTKRYTFNVHKMSIEREGKHFAYTTVEHSKVVNELNNLDKIAEGNEKQLLRVMSYLHDKYYDIWEEVNKECYDD